MGSGSSSAPDPQPAQRVLSVYPVGHGCVYPVGHGRKKEIEELGQDEAMMQEYSRLLSTLCRNIFTSDKAPPVFLSYEMDHQKEAMALKSSLQREGFDCWLDIGQMGVGESLQMEIKKGMERCQVVVFCITNKFTQSANCQREVDLWNDLGKKMIPVKFEETAWPPSGNMGQTFTRYVKYIKLYRNQKSKDGELWPPEKFDELVFHINRIVPRGKAVLPTDTTSTTGFVQEFRRLRFALSNMIIVYKAPHIFLSYNWDHKPEVKALKSSLQQQGFDCWIDDGRIEGGENVDAAIEKGIQDCRVFILCVTTKYMQSESCQREVDLSNKLGKEMIPILLEKIDWPPIGSMGPILTNKVYIEFYQNQKSEDGKPWPSEKFSELVRRIRRIVRPDKTVIPKLLKRSATTDELKQPLSEKKPELGTGHSSSSAFTRPRRPPPLKRFQI